MDGFVIVWMLQVYVEKEGKLNALTLEKYFYTLLYTLFKSNLFGTRRISLDLIILHKLLGIKCHCCWVNCSVWSPGHDIKKSFCNHFNLCPQYFVHTNERFMGTLAFWAHNFAFLSAQIIILCADNILWEYICILWGQISIYMHKLAFLCAQKHFVCTKISI